MIKKLKKVTPSNIKNNNPIKINIVDGVFQITENYKGGYESFGMENIAMLRLIVHQVISSCSQNNEVIANGAIAMYHTLKPQDDYERLLVSQMIASHNIAMEFSRRAMLPDQTFEGVNANVNRTTKFMRTFTMQMETLKRYRTGGKQTIQVQHVNVNDGGQALVGNVNKGVG